MPLFVALLGWGLLAGAPAGDVWPGIEKSVAGGQYRHALEELARLPATPRRHLLASKAWDGLGDPQRAVQEAEAALSLAPALEAAHLQLGQIFLSRNTPEAALEIFTEALGVLPDSLLLRLGRGLALKDLLRYDEAEKELAECLRRRPGFPIAFDALATVYLHSKRYPEAMGLADDYRRRYPADYRGPYFAAAAREGAKQDPAEALALARESVQRNARYAAGYALIGKLLLQSGSAKEAVAPLERAVALRPDYTPAVLHLAQAYKANGQEPEAARAFEQLRQLKAREQIGSPALRYHRGTR